MMLEIGFFWKLFLYSSVDPHQKKSYNFITLAYVDT